MPPESPAPVRTLQALLPGLLVAVIVGFAALFLGDHYSAPVMLFALLLGMALAFLYEDNAGRCAPGIEFAAAFVLRVGVALLGLRVALGDILKLGAETVFLLVIAITLTIALGVLSARLLKLRATLGLLTGGAVAICGASAAMAIASILPRHRDSDRDTLLTIIGVTSLSTVAMVTYPVVARWCGLDDVATSVFLGGTIHDVAQVVGAGYSVSEETGDLATLVKLVRVSLLFPVVAVMLIGQRLVSRGDGSHGTLPGFPWFLGVFMALMILNSVVDIPASILGGFSQGSRFALVVAIAAIGMKSSLGKLLGVGARPLLLIISESLFIAGFILLALRLL